VVGVGLPSACPHCGGRLAVERVARQYQEDLPPRSTVVTRYDLQIGRCRGCRRRIQPRHPEQTSDALGAAGVQVGPRAVALAVWLSKGLGLPAAKVARLLGQLGLRVTPGGVVGALHRAGRRATPTWDALVGGIRASPVVAPDETGLAGGWPQGVAVGVCRPGRGRLSHRLRSRLRGCQGGAWRRLRRGAGTRRVGAVSAVRQGIASDLPGAPAAPLP
jgi:hypothetical protein